MGSGTTNYVVKWQTTTTLSSTSVMYDNGTNVGFGTTSPARKIDVRGDYQFIHNPVTGLTASGEYYGDIVTFGSGSLSAGRIYYLDSSSVWQVAIATGATVSSGLLAMAIGTTPSAGMLIQGYYRLSTLAGSTGDKLYLSTSSPGLMTATLPSGSGQIVRIVAYNLDSTNKVLYFDPENTYLELV